MAEQFERVPRPSAAVEAPGVSTNRGLSRHALMLLISAVALFAGLAGAGVSYYRFYAAEQQKLRNEAKAIQIDARANDVIEEMYRDPRSHPKLREELRKLDSDLTYQPSFGVLDIYESVAFGIVAKRTAEPALMRRKLSQDKKEAEAATGNQIAETELHKKETARAHQQTRIETQRANIQEGVTTPALIQQLRRAADGAVSGNPNSLGMPSLPKKGTEDRIPVSHDIK